MKQIKVISFDLDGTLTNSSFVDSVWLKEIPKAYAIKNKISIEKAKIEVLKNYSKIGNEKLEWYNIDFWIDSFNLDIKPQVILNSNKDKIQLFEDVPFILKKLFGSKKRLIVISNARREFLDLEITQTGIGNFFEHVFSATSDFELIKNDPEIYLEVCKICRISPSEMVHIGDDYKFDFKIPRELGINVIFLDRKKRKKGKFTIHSLKDLAII
jgi:putative hydrolase of the HAD superfamily